MDKNRMTDIADKVINASMKYPAAVGCGVTLMVFESAPFQYLRKNLRPDMENENLGNCIERYRLGYNLVINAFNYNSPR